MAQSLLWTAICFAVEAVCRFALHWGFPYNYPAVAPGEALEDFRGYIHKFAFFHSKEFFAGARLTYPAPTVVTMKLFLLPQPQHQLFVTLRFLAAIIVSSLVLLALLRRALIRRGLAPRTATLWLLGVYVCAFGFWFEVHQANIEFAVWLVVTAALWAYWTERLELAAVLIGVAGAMKIFPFVFVGLLLARKRYRLAVLSFGVAAVVTVVSLWLLCPDIAYSWHETQAAIASMGPAYMTRLNPIDSGFDHTLFTLIKRLMPTLPPPSVVQHMLTAYLAVAAVTGLVIFFVRIRKLPAVNQILCLSVAAILLPPVSFDYTLIHLYAPLALLAFVALAYRDPAPRGLALMLGLLAFTLSPQSELIVHGTRVAGQFKAVALLALFVVGLLYPLPDPRSRDVVLDEVV